MSYSSQRVRPLLSQKVSPLLAASCRSLRSTSITCPSNAHLARIDPTCACRRKAPRKGSPCASPWARCPNGGSTASPTTYAPPTAHPPPPNPPPVSEPAHRHRSRHATTLPPPPRRGPPTSGASTRPPTSPEPRPADRPPSRTPSPNAITRYRASPAGTEAESRCSHTCTRV